MRITAIEIENFKGIGERVRVELSPITLLFGANSAGKSTILHALIYLRDVLERRNLNAITTPVSGAALDLGGFRQFVHERDLDRPIRIRVDMEVTGEELPVMAARYGYDNDVMYPDGAETVDENIEWAESVIKNSIHSASVEIEVRWNEGERHPAASAYQVGLNNKDFCRIELNAGKIEIVKLDLLHPAVSRPRTPEEMEEARKLESLFNELEEHNETKEQKKRPPWTPSEEERYEKLIHIILRTIIFKKGGSLVGLLNWFPDRKDPIPDFAYRENLALPQVNWKNRYFSHSNSGWDAGQQEIARAWAWDGTEFLARLFIGPGLLVRRWLQNLRYIGPLRARPPREGIPDAVLDDWAEGLAAWKALEGSTAEHIQEVSDWLSGEDRLNSGYRLVRKRLVELDADGLDQQLASRPTKTGLRALLKDATARQQIHLAEMHSGLKLMPSEVGVGLSQVLPIVVAGLESPNGVVSIEQPELHIHPAMQVALGDLFIEGAMNRSTHFLIETHSEHLILRLLRRIREAGEQESGTPGPSLKPDDVAVIWVERTANGVQMTRLPIDETGEFTETWPKGFFEERAGELF